MSGLKLQSVVADIVDNSGWKWLAVLTSKYPCLSLIHNPGLTLNSPDKLWWVDKNGDDVQFSVSIVWETIRPYGTKVSWCDAVWFSQCIPRHVFLVWLIMRRSLKTHDRLKAWNISVGVNIANLKCVV